MNLKEYIVQRGNSNFSEALMYFTRILRKDFDTINPQAIEKQQEYLLFNVYLDMSERFINELCSKFKGFSTFKGYIITGCDGSIF